MARSKDPGKRHDADISKHHPDASVANWQKEYLQKRQEPSKAQAAHDRAMDAEDARIAAEAERKMSLTVNLTDADMDRIVGSYRVKSALLREPSEGQPGWRDKLKQHIEMLAWFYVNGKAEKQLTPSAVKAELEPLEDNTKKLVAALYSLNPYLHYEILQAAKELASKVDGLPDFESESFFKYPEALTEWEFQSESFFTGEGSLPDGPTLRHWPVDLQLAKVRKELDWLIAVLDAAQCRVKPTRPGGKREDVHLHELVRRIDWFYRETAADPRDPYYSDLNEQAQGELLILLQACLYPLGIFYKAEALRGLWRRATEGEVPKKRLKRGTPA